MESEIYWFSFQVIICIHIRVRWNPPADVWGTRYCWSSRDTSGPSCTRRVTWRTSGSHSAGWSISPNLSHEGWIVSPLWQYTLWLHKSKQCSNKNKHYVVSDLGLKSIWSKYDLNIDVQQILKITENLKQLMRASTKNKSCCNNSSCIM